MTPDTLERLRRRELAPAELVTVLRHVGGCATCASLGENVFAGDIAALRESVEGAAPSDHPDPDTELMAYVDGTADAATREIVESHLEDCASCRAEVRDLRAAAAEYRGGQALLPVRGQARVPVLHRWLAVAAAVIILIAVAVMLSNRRTRDPQLPPVVTTTQPIDSTAPPERVPYANAQWEALVSTALKTARLPFPSDLDSLRGPEDRLRGEGPNGTHMRFSPSGKVIDETRPRFTWPSVDRATYVVSVFENDNLIAQSGKLRRTEWTPPRDLPRGRTLLWQVEAARDGGAVEILPEPPAPQTMFRIAGAEAHADLELARREHPDDPLLLSVLYARAGLRDEALAELRRVDVTKVPEARHLTQRFAPPS